MDSRRAGYSELSTDDTQDLFPDPQAQGTDRLVQAAGQAVTRIPTQR